MKWDPRAMSDDELRQHLADCERELEDGPGWTSVYEMAKMLKEIVAEGNRRGLGFANKYPIKKGFGR